MGKRTGTTYGTDGDDFYIGKNNGDDYSGGAGNDQIFGGGGRDLLSGDAGDDCIFGGAGDDTLSGGDGNDQLHGDKGDDVLDGGAGNDWLDGGVGHDVMTGGAGADKFVLDSDVMTRAGSDTITDFNVVENDVLELNGLLQGFDPLASALANFVQMAMQNGSTVVSVDVDGALNGANFVQVATLTGVTGMDEAALLASGNLVIS